MRVYNEFCATKGCEHYIEWEFSNYPDEQPYPCTSCKLVGQSYNITEYPENCPFLDEIKNIDLNNRK